jgi:hypothetical protein
MTGQFVKDKPAGQMKALSDRLLGTHLAAADDKETVCCPPSVGVATVANEDAGAKAGGGGCCS